MTKDILIDRAVALGLYPNKTAARKVPIAELRIAVETAQPATFQVGGETVAEPTTEAAIAEVREQMEGPVVPNVATTWSHLERGDDRPLEMGRPQPQRRDPMYQHCDSCGFDTHVDLLPHACPPDGEKAPVLPISDPTRFDVLMSEYVMETVMPADALARLVNMIDDPRAFQSDEQRILVRRAMHANGGEASGAMERVKSVILHAKEFSETYDEWKASQQTKRLTHRQARQLRAGAN